MVDLGPELDKLLKQKPTVTEAAQGTTAPGGDDVVRIRKDVYRRFVSDLGRIRCDFEKLWRTLTALSTFLDPSISRKSNPAALVSNVWLKVFVVTSILSNDQVSRSILGFLKLPRLRHRREVEIHHDGLNCESGLDIQVKFVGFEHHSGSISLGSESGN